MVTFYAQLTDRRKMKREKLIEILNFITTVECSDEQKKALLEMAANTITIDKLSELVGSSDGKETEQDKASESNEVGIVKFTKKEISQMPTYLPQERTEQLELYDSLPQGRLQYRSLI